MKAHHYVIIFVVAAIGVWYANKKGYIKIPQIAGVNS